MNPTPNPSPVTASPQILFKPSNVFVEYRLRQPDGTPVVLTEQQVEDLMKLEFVDAADEGSGNNPAEVVFAFDHPMDAHPASLLEMQKVVLEVLELGWHAYVDAADTGDVDEPEAPADHRDQQSFIPSEE